MLVLGASAGCSDDAGNGDGGQADADVRADGATPGDAPPGIDGPPVDPCNTWSFLPRHFNACVIRDPQGALALDRPDDPGNAQPFYLYNTTDGRLTDPDGSPIAHQSQVLSQLPGIRLASLESFSIAAGTTLRVVGEHPLLLVSWERMDIAGVIDASSQGDYPGVILDDWQTGGGANPVDCDSGGTGADGDTGGDAIGEGSGGGGGGFGENAGVGGTTDSRLGGAGGQAVPKTPDNLRGGCAGGRGGDGTNGSTAPGSGGQGGAGGGAIHLTARLALTVAGTARIHAGGAGGWPGQPDIGGPGNTSAVGGGGGGSGGWIGLEASSIDVQGNAVLAANGGGGGSGADTAMGAAGDDGRLGAESAAGGAGGNGGFGGSGGSSAGTAGAPGLDHPKGGGGGGGSSGFVLMTAINTDVAPTAVVSPAYITE